MLYAYYFQTSRNITALLLWVDNVPLHASITLPSNTLGLFKTQSNSIFDITTYDYVTNTTQESQGSSIQLTLSYTPVLIELNYSSALIQNGFQNQPLPLQVTLDFSGDPQLYTYIFLIPISFGVGLCILIFQYRRFSNVDRKLKGSE